MPNNRPLTWSNLKFIIITDFKWILYVFANWVDDLVYIFLPIQAHQANILVQDHAGH